jgi:Homeodomain-like domain
MSDNPNVLNDSCKFSHANSASIEIDERRQHVVTLRLRGLSQTQIARSLKVHQSTVSRDGRWIAEHWKELYGTPANLQIEQEIGEAIDLFQDTEVSALRDYHRLNAEKAKQRNACLRTAILARQMRVNLLLSLGLLHRQSGNSGVTLRADVVRQMLRDSGLLNLNQDS